jgi:SAM-dependent methyltransferase
MRNIKSAVDIFDKYALSYEDKFMSVEKYHPSLNLFCSLLSRKNASILELACGPGNITKYLLGQQPDLNIIATDLSPAMIKLAQKNNPGISTQLLDCRSILELESVFDAIVCGFGLPYFSKEEALKIIADASISLHSGGLLYLSTMEDDYTKSGYKGSSTDADEGLIMYFHEADYLVEALEKNGFKEVDISRVEYIDHHNEPVVDLIIIGKK